VNDSLASKIKGLSVLTGKTASDITGDLSGHIEGLINQELIRSIGISPQELVDPITHRSGFSRIVDSTIPEGTPGILTRTRTAEEEVKSYSMVEGLGGSEDSFDDYDDELPDHMVEKLDNSALPENERPKVDLPQEKSVEEPVQEKPADEFIFPEDNEESKEEEILMPIKDKDGNDAGYEDEVMNDFQEELESGDLDGVSDDSYDHDDDEREFEEDRPQKSKATVSGHIPSDAPAAEGYENTAPDVLPMDYGINQVSAEDGQVSGAIDFFNNAFDGIQGDKTARNNVQRKRIITGF